MRKISIKNYHFRAFLSIIILYFFQGTANGQVVDIGFKAGLLTSWVRYDDPAFRKVVKVHPIMGISGGPVVSFKVKDRFFLHTEYLFTTKGRKNTGKIDPELKDKVNYYFIEVPVLYNMFFKGHLKLHGDKRFKYYAGAGPLFSYWLGGTGKIYSDEFRENNYPEQKYSIRFGTREPDFIKTDEVYIEKARRLQLGFALGGGLMTEPDSKHRIMLDMRFEYGHSWLAKSETEDFYIPVTYDPSVKARNMSLRLSGIYMLEMNTNKRVRNKGKSTIKRRSR